MANIIAAIMAPRQSEGNTVFLIAVALLSQRNVWRLSISQLGKYRGHSWFVAILRVISRVRARKNL